MFDAVIKVGGSLHSNSQALQATMLALHQLARRYRLLVLPGGGPFADAVRAADTSFGLSNSAAHWMAILAMDQYSYLLADSGFGGVPTHDPAQAATRCAAGQLAILAPYALLRQHDPLPHSWDVTSDSLAAWLAGFVRAPLLVLLKSLPGVLPDGHSSSDAPLPVVSRNDAARYNIVDSYFARALADVTVCWLIDGHRPERLAQLLATGHTVGTRVVH